ncbi:MAG: sigma-70 family RNA polymerase sigma factor [Faecalibacterium sp.]|nr:sigma-70 family RNA polymerase sigma factor [Ruminococcus sp.]MCM1392893.1 sigma-70 family RNA polymerase sigma factor [Ruminococcus sp.]MCM1485650.1 sigma-70 family RNA polymerase sigma factor [Faecalibacterium sp.]
MYKLKSIPDKVDDCVQETFAALVEAFEKGQYIENYKAWLTVVVNNIIKDVYDENDKAKRTITELNDYNLHKIGISYTDEDKIFAIADEQILLYKEQVLMQLTDSEKQLIYDRYTLKKTISEMAEEQNTTENNIYQKFARLRKRTKYLIKKCLIEQDAQKLV